MRVSGQVDRLAVTQDAVLIADFKTDRPRAAANRRGAAGLRARSSRSIVRCCKSSIPSQTVRAALVWTEVPDLMELSADDAG